MRWRACSRSRRAGRAAARASPDAPLSSWIRDPGAVVRLAHRSSKKPGPLPDVNATVTPRIVWQVERRHGGAGLCAGDHAGGDLRRSQRRHADAPRPRHRTRGLANQRRQARFRRVRARSARSSSSAPTRATCSRSTTDGKPLWTARVSERSDRAAADRRQASSSCSSGDGRIFGLAAADGKTAWVHQRTNPPLTVRNAAGGVVEPRRPVRRHGRRAAAGDRRCDRATIGWDGAVATPKGATELERIADVTSLPFVDEKAVCAVAYQGRVACFDIVRGTLHWSRDVSSLAGIAADAQRLTSSTTRARCTRSTSSNGASIWKQDVLASAAHRRTADRRRRSRRRRRRRLSASARAHRRLLRRPARNRRQPGDRRSRAPRRRRNARVAIR